MQLHPYLKSYFLAEKFPPARRWNVGMTRVFTWCAVSGFLIQTLASFAFLKNNFLGIFSLGCVAVMLLAIKLNDQGRTKPARIIRMVVALIFFGFMTAHTGGLQSACFYWGAVFVLGSMFSFGNASAVPTMLAITGLATYHYLKDFDHFYFLQLLSSLSFIYFLSLLFDRLSKHFISYAETQKKKAESAREQAETARLNTKSILESVNEGILSILPSGVIDNVESPYFARLIGQEPYVERTIKEVLLDRLQISADVKDQCWQTILTVVGEDELNFWANASLLIASATYSSGTIQRDLRLKWSPIIEQGSVIKLTLAVEDITQQKLRDKELDQRRSELAMIAQLLDVNEDRARAFLMTAERLLHENTRCLEKDSLNHEDIRILFVNSHTVKGAARTLGFNQLSPLIHEAEEQYQKILKQGAPINKTLLKTQHGLALAMLQQYKDINYGRLKRSESSGQQHLTIERSFLEQYHQVVVDALHSINSNSLSLDDFANFLKDQNRQLAGRIFDLLPSIFQSYEPALQRVAESLGKPKPKIVADLPDVAIHPDIRSVLDNCMTHIIRNAIDHGIETPEERRSKGKPEVGQIQVKAREQEDSIELWIADDGRGLAIDRLQQRAMDLGLGPNLPTQDVAELIFRSGISTSAKVTEISGRGVGMDAVHRYFSEIGGNIAIELLGASEPGYQKFAFRIKLPRKIKRSPQQAGKSQVA
ncbi:ATP-binding protein [Oligoflexus tunisiensis]|uniref:ATP-binding protein n=1 Tax=Oligoflexus tunisiensis TaxID=708132 RepID=UPI000B154145|nr:ATP-binding protein [Oligoflexus tunisiensis]